MKNLLLLIILYSILFSCRKPVDEEINVFEVISHCNYDLYSTQDIDSIGQSINYGGPGEPAILTDDFDYFNPVFNPNNSCEFLYLRQDNELFGDQSGLFKFNTETGESSLITQECYFNADWGKHGWIIFTGPGFQLYKIKENGDSLMQLSDNPGISNAGTWNPSGTMFWFKNDNLGGGYYVDLDGEIIHEHSTVPFGILDWISDSLILGMGNGNKLYSLSIPEENMTILNSNEIDDINLQVQTVFDRENMNVYSQYINQADDEFYYLRYDLSGSNVVDTLTEVFVSYRFAAYLSQRLGDVQDGRIITTLHREEYPDTTVYELYERNNILIMDLDCSNQRLVELP